MQAVHVLLQVDAHKVRRVFSVAISRLAGAMEGGSPEAARVLYRSSPSLVRFAGRGRRYCWAVFHTGAKTWCPLSREAAASLECCALCMSCRPCRNVAVEEWCPKCNTVQGDVRQRMRACRQKNSCATLPHTRFMWWRQSEQAAYAAPILQQSSSQDNLVQPSQPILRTSPDFCEGADVKMKDTVLKME